jgi:type I restriction enzyme M protein
LQRFLSTNILPAYNIVEIPKNTPITPPPVCRAWMDCVEHGRKNRPDRISLPAGRKSRLLNQIDNRPLLAVRWWGWYIGKIVPDAVRASNSLHKLHQGKAASVFEQAFKNIDDVLWKEAGCTTELDYTEQTSWLLFLKYLDSLEQDKADEAKLEGKRYAFILEKPYRWESWAAPKNKDGKLDHNTALTGDDLRDFVNGKLFPYLHGFKQKASGPNTIEYKIGEIFGEIKNKVQSGYNLREIIDHIDELRFRSQNEKHELSHLYEAKIKNMGNAGRNGGEYYTPRPLIRAIVRVVKPKIGERIYDGAVGSAGFLCESFDFMKAKKSLTTKDLTTLQTRTFYGKEKKSLAYVIAIMNMILHGIETPNIIHTNTLTENLADIQEKDRFDIVLANPPFGGKERKEVQQNFPIRTGETAFLFLQHFIKMLKAGGRGGVVIKNTFLSNSDNASVSLRKLLLESCSLHTVLDCPGGTFQGAGVKTVVLFFEKGSPTRKTWFYQLDPGRNLGKTNPLNDDDLAEFLELQKTFADSPKSWSVDAKSIDKATFDLSVKNPNSNEEVKHRSPQKIMDEIAKLDAESTEVLQTIRGLL